MHYDFELAGRRVRLWQRPGESYEHVLMKALGYAMYVGAHPQLEIEVPVGLRYKPDLVARASGLGGVRFAFWGECGMTSLRKLNWLLKHAGVARVVLFKIMGHTDALVLELRAQVPARYRGGGRLVLVNFNSDIVARSAARRIARVPQNWYTETLI